MKTNLKTFPKKWQYKRSSFGKIKSHRQGYYYREVDEWKENFQKELRKLHDSLPISKAQMIIEEILGE